MAHQTDALVQKSHGLQAPAYIPSCRRKSAGLKPSFCLYIRPFQRRDRCAGPRVRDSNHHSAYISALFKGEIAAQVQECGTQTIIPLIYIRPFQRRDRRAGPRLQDSNYYSAYISALFKGGGPLRLRSGGGLAASAAFPIKGTCRRRFLPLAAD